MDTCIGPVDHDEHPIFCAKKNEILSLEIEENGELFLIEGKVVNNFIPADAKSIVLQNLEDASKVATIYFDQIRSMRGGCATTEKAANNLWKSCTSKFPYSRLEKAMAAVIAVLFVALFTT